MKCHTPGAVLAAVLLAASPALATDHMDFQRRQCNSDQAGFDAQILGCTRISQSDLPEHTENSLFP